VRFLPWWALPACLAGTIATAVVPAALLLLNAELREALRARLGRDPEPSAGIVDSQSVKSTGVGGQERGFDPAKKVRGRKRHLLVDTEGLVLEARVHSARVPDQDGIRLLLEPVRGRFARLSHS